MIKHTQNGTIHEVTPMTEKAARFFNSFVFRTLILSEKEWQSAKMEMSSHGVWEMGCPHLHIGNAEACPKCN